CTLPSLLSTLSLHDALPIYVVQAPDIVQDQDDGGFARLFEAFHIQAVQFAVLKFTLHYFLTIGPKISTIIHSGRGKRYIRSHPRTGANVTEYYRFGRQEKNKEGQSLDATVQQHQGQTPGRPVAVPGGGFL